MTKKRKRCNHCGSDKLAVDASDIKYSGGRRGEKVYCKECNRINA